MVKQTLEYIINNLKPKNEYQKWVIQTPIRLNMQDKCYDEVVFYLNDVFGINVSLADLEADAMDRQIEDRVDCV